MIGWYTDRAQITPSDRIALLRSFSVDGGTLHTFAALLNGAAVLPFDLKREGIGQLSSWFSNQAITICGGLGATTFSQFGANSLRETSISRPCVGFFSAASRFSESTSICAGAISRADCIVVNALGATEASNFCEFIIGKNEPRYRGSGSLRYATPDMEVQLLDQNGAEVDSGEIGEIAVKSRYIALEYWRRPELTREKFLLRGDERLYLTGDLGVKRADGCLIYAGRKDFPTKIRGHRIEIGDIEAALLDLDNICNAAVAVQEETTGEKTAHGVHRSTTAARTDDQHAPPRASSQLARLYDSRGICRARNNAADSTRKTGSQSAAGAGAAKTRARQFLRAAAHADRTKTGTNLDRNSHAQRSRHS